MKSQATVAVPPSKPLMVYDGDCNFCTLWIHRWRCTTGEAVEYIPFQDPSVAIRFPEIPAAHFEKSVHLIMTDGSVYTGAEAVFRSLASNAHAGWMLDGYQHSAPFARISEATYRFVADHRPIFSWLTRLLWGRNVASPTHIWVRWTFLRSLAVIYLIAFLSLWVQITGLIGSNGIIPVAQEIRSAREQVTAENMGVERYRLMPTLCWFNTSDAFLNWQCAGGVVLSVLLFAGVAPAPCLFLLWIIYLSLTTASNVFLGFQWDNLLLEVGFLAIFFAPLQVLPRRVSREAPPSRIVLWLLRWLLFRLMFESGCVKLASHDPIWRNLTALQFHYETQPLPTWIGWFAHQLPTWVHKSDAAMMFAIELAVPFLIFAPRRPRQFAVLAFCALQLFILLTGNYCFFNLLTMVLCIPLLDDAALQRCWPANWRRQKFSDDDRASDGPAPCDPTCVRKVKALSWPKLVTLPLAVVVISTTLVPLAGVFGKAQSMPPTLTTTYRWLLPFRTFNGYGLFAVMTTNRLEIIIEGSNDGVRWDAYEFKYKPGDLKQKPRFVQPHQPRLDWQMWFAALGNYRRNPWLVNLCLRLLEGSPRVVALLERNPFPDAPPRYIRAVVYEYHFTNRATRRQTGEWWRRDYKGLYLPAIALREATQ